MTLTLSVLPGEYAVCQLSPTAPLPVWATTGELFSVTRTPGELSVVCAAKQVPNNVPHAAGWTALMLHGPFDSTLTGILAGVLNPLHNLLHCTRRAWASSRSALMTPITC
jgi:uncharacterized protein